MNTKLIKAELEKLSLMLSSWDKSEQISTIERDIVLDKLKNIYDAIRFDTALEESIPMATPPVQEPSEDDNEKEVEVELIFADDEFPEEVLVDDDITDDNSVSATDIFAATVASAIGGAVVAEKPEVEEEVVDEEADNTPEVSAPIIEVAAPMVEPEPEPQPEPQPEIIEIAPVAEPEPVIETESTPKPVVDIESTHTSAEEPKVETTPIEKPAAAPKRQMDSLFNMEEVRRPRSKHQRMMSIYNDSEPKQEKVVDISKIFNIDLDEPVMPEPATTPKPVESPKEKIAAVVEEKPATLADAIPAPQTLADTLVAPTALAEEINHSQLNSLREGIGINDKFLMIRDLFDGDGDAYEAAINALDKLETLDDCMIHIIENYAWNPDSEGSKFIMQLLERKLS